MDMKTETLHISDFDYDLPQNLIAQYPIAKRDESKLLVLHRKSGKIEHRIFKDITDYFCKGDVVVMNKTKVLPARIYGKKITGGNIEILMLDSERALVKPRKSVKAGTKIFIKDISGNLTDQFAEVVSLTDTYAGLKFSKDLKNILDLYGRIPLPPYIKRPAEVSDRERYQTVFATNDGSVAAPTAGLHFTEEVISGLKSSGVSIAEVLLHISWSTFAPVRTEIITEHKMGVEYYEIDKRSSDLINCANRVICVGTTSLRVVETVGREGTVMPDKGYTDMFIYPGYKFKITDGMITNFHLPKTTLFMLVCALAGRKNILKAYDEAKDKKYRFASYGDAMLII